MERAETMDCRSIAAGCIVERYLAGTLPEPERDAFESHYFGCEGCFQALETARAVREGLSSLRPRVRRAAGFWIAAAAAAGLFLAISGAPSGTPDLAARPAQPPQAPLIQLAEIRPPHYSATVFRGASGAGAVEFDRAMAHYLAGRYAQALPALSAIPPASARYWEARHFGAACLLLLGRTDEALASWDAVIERGTTTPFEEEARYYRALALLAAGRAAEARAELLHVEAMRGDYEERARQWLERR